MSLRRITKVSFLSFVLVASVSSTSASDEPRAKKSSQSKQIEALQAENQRLTEANKKLRERIKGLRKKLREMRAKLREARSKKPTSASRSVAEGLTWRQYMADCGTKAQEENEAKTEETFREKYKGKTVSWVGDVVGVEEAILGGYAIRVKMDPSESLIADLTLQATEGHKKVVLTLKKGTRIRFTGVLDDQGGTFTNHSVKLTQISPM